MTVSLLTSKEAALAAGVPAELFDPEIHLHNEVITQHPPVIVANAVPPEEISHAG